MMASKISTLPAALGFLTNVFPGTLGGAHSANPFQIEMRTMNLID
jgi:hypothetical protein